MITPEKYFKTVPQMLNMDIRSELYYVNEFTFAVAVALSAQATDKKVNEVTPELFKIAPTPADMIKLGTDGLKQHIKVLSFFNNKAKNIIAMAGVLMNEENNNDINYKFPKKYHKRENLMKLPAIGQKTANVVMNVLWDAPNIGVDTHVFRLSHRFGWVGVNENTPEKVESALLQKIPKKYHAIANHVMVLHGRYFCKALRPQCQNCLMNSICNAPDRII